MSRIALPPDMQAAASRVDRAQAAVTQLVISGARSVYGPLAAEEIRTAIAESREPNVALLKRYAEMAQLASMVHLEPFGLAKVTVQE